MWCSPMTVLFDWTTNWFGFVCVCVSQMRMDEWIYIYKSTLPFNMMPSLATVTSASSSSLYAEWQKQRILVMMMKHNSRIEVWWMCLIRLTHPSIRMGQFHNSTENDCHSGSFPLHFSKCLYVLCVCACWDDFTFTIDRIVWFALPVDDDDDELYPLSLSLSYVTLHSWL